jgi:hypothetical protein
VTVAAAVVLFAGESRAWIYPEHQEIAFRAVQDLDAGRRALFDRIWADARKGKEERLCARSARPAGASTSR